MTEIMVFPYTVPSESGLAEVRLAEQTSETAQATRITRTSTTRRVGTEGRDPNATAWRSVCGSESEARKGLKRETSVSLCGGRGQSPHHDKHKPLSNSEHNRNPSEAPTTSEQDKYP